MAAARRREPDPPTQLARLAEALRGASGTRALVLRGEERYFRERGIELALAAAAERGLEACRHDLKDPEFELARLLDDLGAQPLFAAARCVVVRNADGPTIGHERPLDKVDGKASPLTRSALAFLGRADAGMLVVDARTLRVDHALAKAVAGAGGVIVTCRRLWDSPPPWGDPDPRRAELVQWLLARARERRIRLAPDDAVYLAAATGNDLSALETQLEKLHHAAGRGLRELVGWDSGGTPWRAAEELLCGDPARGLKAVEALFRAGFQDERKGRRELAPAALAAILIGSLRTAVRRAEVGARALAEGLDARAAAERLGVAKGGPAFESFEARSRARDAAGWRRIAADVAEVERKARRQPGPDASDFALLALRWGSGRGKRA